MAKDSTEKVIKKLSKNYWAVAAVILAILLVAVLIYNTTRTISAVEAEQKLTAFASSQGVTLDVVGTEDMGSLYAITVSIQGQDGILYISKDGKFFSSGIIPLEETETTQTPTETPTQNIVKSDKPIVELFVMTHCPYGTQAEKGYLSAIAELGNNIDASVKFVHYFLHAPEETETPIQICIREEQNTKYISYLTCFLEDGDSARCQTEVNIDKTKLNTCISSGKWEDYYAEDSTQSQGYGVQGSPTLVINGQIISTGRSPAGMLSTICSAFNNAPDACSQELDTTSPNPGFGWSVTGAATTNTDAQC